MLSSSICLLVVCLLCAVLFLSRLFGKRRSKDESRFFAASFRFIWYLECLNRVDRFLAHCTGDRLRLVKLQREQHIKALAASRYIPKGSSSQSYSTEELTKMFGNLDDLDRGMHIWIEESTHCPRLSAVGRYFLNMEIQNKIQQRQLVMKYILDHPQIADVVIRRPLVVTGLARAGTTLLYNLLSCDSATRFPKGWEMGFYGIHPLPPLTCEEDAMKHPVRLASLSIKKEMERIIPDWKQVFFASHPLDFDRGHEEYIILANLWLSLLTSSVFTSDPSYNAGDPYFNWLMGQEDNNGPFHMVDRSKHSSYLYVQRYMQMLASGYQPSSHWTFKTSLHSLFMEFLQIIYLDAHLVVMHRHPRDVVASHAQLQLCLCRKVAIETDRRIIGKQSLRLCEVMVKRMMHFRSSKAGAAMPILDVFYDDLMQDPIGQVKKIYQFHRLNFTPVFEENMKKYINDNPQGKLGRNSYSLEEFGLSEQDIQQRFAQYLNKYGFD